MSYGSNMLGQENALGYPYPKWHPHYDWGWGQAAPRQPPLMVGDPNIRPPGSWFGRPVVGLTLTRSHDLPAVSAGAGLLVGGAAYLLTRSIVGALLGGGAAALLATYLPIWSEDEPAIVPRGGYVPRGGQ